MSNEIHARSKRNNKIVTNIWKMTMLEECLDVDYVGEN